MLKTDTKKRLIEGIAVYNPECPWQKAIQDSYHQYNGDWLPSFACQIVAKALDNLKPEWMNEPHLYYQRASYIFSPSMSANKDQVVFVTYPLYLRDILENNEVNSFLHFPITFVSLPIAHFLLREYPIQLIFDWSKLQSENHEVNFIEVGGLIIAEDNVKLGDALINTMERDDALSKAAATEISRDIYKIDEPVKNLLPQTEIWDKLQRRKAKVEIVGIGEADDILVVYDSGDELTFPKITFEERFVVTKVASCPLYRININGQESKLTEQQIAKLVKDKLKNSRVVQNTCKEFKVDIDRINDLQIIITDLDSRYAETDEKTMKLNRSMMQRDFFDNYFFVCVHEIVHWLSRVKESGAFFNDPEEVLGFVTAIAYELENGLNYEQIYQKVFPKISWHFNDDNKAKIFFDKSIEKAKHFVV